jgi:uncharacterized protein
VKVTTLRRYPIKSMLGETVSGLDVDEGGADGDRRLALIDAETGRVATAKHPRLWRSLLRFAASGDPGRVRIRLPDGGSVGAADAGVDELLSGLLGRAVRLAARRPAGAEVERPAPEDVLERGVEAEVEFATLVIAQGTPGGSFVDYAPLHLITTATLAHIGAEAVRYRPNLVVETPSGYPPYAENDWVGRELTVGGARLRGGVAHAEMFGTDAGTRRPAEGAACGAYPDDGEPGRAGGLRGAAVCRAVPRRARRRADPDRRPGHARLSVQCGGLIGFGAFR